MYTLHFIHLQKYCKWTEKSAWLFVCLVPQYSQCNQRLIRWPLRTRGATDSEEGTAHITASQRNWDGCLWLLHHLIPQKQDKNLVKKLKFFQVTVSIPRDSPKQGSEVGLLLHSKALCNSAGHLRIHYLPFLVPAQQTGDSPSKGEGLFCTLSTHSFTDSSQLSRRVRQYLQMQCLFWHMGFTLFSWILLSPPVDISSKISGRWSIRASSTF